MADSYYINISTCHDILFVIFVAVFTFLLGAYYNRFFCLHACVSVCPHLTTQRENEFSLSLILETSVVKISQNDGAGIFSGDCYREGCSAHFLS
jgi:hypothetical protein